MAGAASTDSSDRAGLAERLTRVDEAIARAAHDAGRDPNGLTRIVVTKFHPASLVRELIDLGVRDFGENRHQEAAPKAAEVADDRAHWHFVGQLQSNKARAAREYVTSVHSVDRPSLARALDVDDGRTIDVFLEVDLSGQPGRGGVAPLELDALVDDVLARPSLKLRGVMAVAPLGEEPRAAFARLKELSDRVQRVAPHADAISAGMSHDFADAIAEGATHLRIGTAITGKRPAQG